MTTVALRTFMRLNTVRLPRREFLQLAASTVTLPAWAHAAAAFDYPARPVRMLVGFAPGATPDVLARLIGEWLSRRFAKSFLVENKPSGNGGVANEAVINAAPDGYTLLMVGIGYAVNPTLYKNTKRHFDRDLTPVARLSRESNVLVVDPAFPAKDVPEFIAHAKAHPGKINMASPGIGTSPHLAGELFKSLAGVT